MLNAQIIAVPRINYWMLFHCSIQTRLLALVIEMPLFCLSLSDPLLRLVGNLRRVPTRTLAGPIVIILAAAAGREA